MTITVELPDDVAQHADAAREALEALAIAGYRSGALDKKDLRALLGIANNYDLDGFLKTNEVFEWSYGIEEYEEDCAQNKRDIEAGLLK